MRSALLPIILIQVALSGCGSSAPVDPIDETPPTPVSVTISESSLTLNALGSEVQLQATVMADDGSMLDEPVAWGSGDTTVVTVSTSGLVTSMGNGQTEVIARAGTLADTSGVEVQQEARGFELVTPSPGLVMGEPGAVEVSVVDSLGRTVVSWSSAVTLELPANPYGSQLTGTLTSAASEGIALFSDLTFSRPGSFGLTATSESVGGPTDSVDVDIRFTMISAGTEVSCGIATDGGAYCWGRNEYGGLGIGETGESRSRPVRLPGDRVWSEVHSGAANDSRAKDGACGVTDAGTALCWGHDGFGRLGRGTTDVPSPVPVEVSGGITFSEVAVTANHACGRDVDGAIHCWGYGGSGSLGIGFDPGDRNTPTQIEGTNAYSLVNVGRTGQSCAVASDGAGYCWHATTLLAGEYYRWVPTQVPGSEIFERLDAADFLHTCGVTTSGDAVCWGQDVYGELGSGTAGVDAGEPSVVVGGHSWADVQAGSQFTCGLRLDGAVLCWGHNGSGQLGDGNAGTSDPTPTVVQGGITFQRISVGTATTCGVDVSGRGYCWGSGRHGQRGDGSFDHTQSIPTPIAIPEPTPTG